MAREPSVHPKSDALAISLLLHAELSLSTRSFTLFDTHIAHITLVPYLTPVIPLSLCHSFSRRLPL